MHKHWVWTQEHMRKVHGKEISRDAILKTAHEHRH